MSALRLGRLADGTRDVRVEEPRVGRAHHGVFLGGWNIAPSIVNAPSEDELARRRELNNAANARYRERKRA